MRTNPGPPLRDDAPAGVQNQGAPRWCEAPRQRSLDDMTQNPPEAPAEHPSDAGGHAGPDGGPRVTRDEIRDLGRLRRSRDDRKIAGVAGGLARHLDIDPIIVRVALVVLIFFGGAGLLIYGAGWLLVPEEGTERRQGAARRPQPERRPDPRRGDRGAGGDRRLDGRAGASRGRWPSSA